jgi:hypothetical protein
VADEREPRKDAPGDPQVRMASERTLLAWVRTGLGLMGFGFVVAKFGLFLRELEAARQAPVATSTSLSLPIGVYLGDPGRGGCGCRRLGALPAPQSPGWGRGIPRAPLVLGRIPLGVTCTCGCSARGVPRRRRSLRCGYSLTCRSVTARCHSRLANHVRSVGA